MEIKKFKISEKTMLYKITDSFKTKLTWKFELCYEDYILNREPTFNMKENPGLIFLGVRKDHSFPGD